MTSFPRRFLSVLTVAFAFAGAPVAHAAGPNISTVFYPQTVTAYVATTLSVNVSSYETVASCNLYVDSEDQGAMTLYSGGASRSHTFPRGGVFTLFVFCKDVQGGKASGPNTSILVDGPIMSQPIYGGGSPSTPSTPSTPSAPAAPSVPAPTQGGPGSLIKLACPPGSEADHPCKAVYYYGHDGKRHAFPNDKVYFTWYANFDSVIDVSAGTLSALPLGKNVTYRSGVRMVKFQTLNNVFAVSKHGVLRWVKDESVASTLYGPEWNTKIDDIADVFYTNYTYGVQIANTGDYVPATETAAALSVDDSL